MLSTEMNWEVVQDFLNVSGIKGVALIDGQSRPYFKGIEKVLNSQQREALAQGVWQVLETIPENFDSFEFQFAGTQVYIHKMTQGLILLVLTHDSLLYPDYCEAFTKLKGAFEADGNATLESFRRLLGARNTTVVAPAEGEEETATEATDSARKAREAAIAQEIAQDLAVQNGNGSAAFTTAPEIAGPQAAKSQTAEPAQAKANSVKAARRPDLEDTLQDVFSEDESTSQEQAAALEAASLKQAAQEKAAQEKAAQEKAAQEKAAKARAAKERAAKERLAQEQAAQKQAAQERAAQKQAQEKAAQPKATAKAEESVPSSFAELEAAQLADTLVDNPFAPAMAAPPDTMADSFERHATSPDRAEKGSSGLPDIGLPDGLPDVGLPEVGLPDVELPEMGLPDVDALSPATASQNNISTPTSAPTQGIDTEASAQGLPLDDWLVALNCLGQCAVHYLGRAVVVNYWRTSCPDSDWLGNFEVERSSEIKANADLPLAHGTTVEQQLELQDWADRFAQRCGRVIRDFPQLAETQGLSAEQRQLLGL